MEDTGQFAWLLDDDVWSRRGMVYRLSLLIELRGMDRGHESRRLPGLPETLGGLESVVTSSASIPFVSFVFFF